MADVKITNPDYHGEKTVDDRGRVYVGKEFSGEQVRVTVERVSEDE